MSDNNLKSKEDVQKMIALSEEISNLNIKVKQLVADLSGAQDVLGSVQELAGQLTSKVGAFEKASKAYTPPNYMTNDRTGTPSYESAGAQRERIMPTPETIKDYQPERYSAQPVSTPVVEDVIEEITKDTKNITGKQDLLRSTKQSRVQRGAKSKTRTKIAPKKPTNTRPPKKWGFGDKKGNE